MSAKHLLIIATLVLLCGCEDREYKARSDSSQALLIKAWDVCIASGGVPIQAWIGAPAMDRCEMKEQGE
jgi:hypothetical protein